MYILFALILAGIGIFNIVDPEEAIYLQNFWKFDDFTPSEWHIRHTRIGGYVLVATAIVIVLIGFAG